MKNSRFDLPDICSRSELHIKINGKFSIPIFRLSSVANMSLFNYVALEVKFSMVMLQISLDVLNKIKISQI